MKTIISSFLALFALVLVVGTTRAQTQQRSPSVAGTYEYMLDKQEGMAIFTETHFVWVISQKSRKPLEANNPSDSAKSVAFSSSFADAGTYQFVGPSRVNIHRLYSSNPNLVGKDFTYEYEFDGDICKYWILKSDGTRGEMGTSRRIKK